MEINNAINAQNENAKLSEDLNKIKEVLALMNSEISVVKNQLSLLLKDKLEDKNEDSEQPKETPNKPESLLKAKNGDFQSEDVSIEKIFYVGGRK